MYQGSKDRSKASGSRGGDSFWTEEQNNFGMKMMKGMGWEQGKGLGKNEDGQKQYLKAKYKADAKGIGATEKQEDATWRATQDLFTEMLQRVKAETQGSPTSSASPVAEESVEVSASSTTTEGANTTTVLKQYIQKRTLYGRFKKAKDTANYSATAMSEIFGRKPVVASSSPWGNTPAITNGSANVKSETKVKQESASGSVAPPANDMQSTSKLSIRDYFAAKLAAAGKLGGMSAAQFAGREEMTAKREARDDEDDHRHGGIGLSHASHVPAAAAAAAAAATGEGFTEDQQESYFNRMMASAIGGKGVQTGRSAKVGLGFGGAGYGGNNPGAGMAGFKQPSALLNARKSVKIDLDAPAVPNVSPEVAAAAVEAAVAAADREADSHPADSPIGAYDEETAEAAADSDSDSDDDKKKKKAKKAEKKRRKAAEAEAAAKAEAEAQAKQAAAAAGSDSDDGDKAAKKAKKKAKKEAAAAAAAAAEAEAAAAAEAQAEADRKAAKKAKKADKKRRREESDSDDAPAAAAKAEPEAVQEKKKKKKSKD